MMQAMAEVDIQPAKVSIVANSTAKPINTVNEIRDELIQQICHCVKWQPSIEYMVANGVSTFIEIGPGQVLSGLIKRISTDVAVFNLGDIESIRTFGNQELEKNITE